MKTIYGHQIYVSENANLGSAPHIKTRLAARRLNNVLRGLLCLAPELSYFPRLLLILRGAPLQIVCNAPGNPFVMMVSY